MAADKERRRPMYRTKQWKRSDRWLAKRRKKKNWLGPFWKSCIFVPPTPGSELKKRMQKKEEETRVGGREGWPMKVIETAGRTLEQTLVNNDPFEGKACNDPKCVPSRDPKNNINCRRSTICYRDLPALPQGWTTSQSRMLGKGSLLLPTASQEKTHIAAARSTCQNPIARLQRREKNLPSSTPCKK